MATINLATAIRNARLQAIATAIDAGTGPGLLHFYDAPKPSAGAAITTQTLLGSVTFADPCAASIADGILTFSALTSDSNADADGICAWARATDSAGGWVADFDVTVTGGGGAIQLNSVTVYAGGTISITTRTITDGNA